MKEKAAADNNFFTFAWILAILLVIFRLVFISTTMVIDDEAYYYQFAAHLAAGYIDHGPVVAVLIRIFTELLGANGFGIRFGGVFLQLLLALILVRFGNRELGRPAGDILGLMVLINLLFHTNSIIMTPDAPMVFFTIITIILYHQAYFKDPKYFLPAGIFMGLALLSKISAVFPFVGIALLPWVVKEKRMLLKDFRYGLSFLVALVVYFPFILWNLQNDLAFFRYQGSHISRIGSLGSFFELWLALALLIGPILFYYTLVLPFRTIFSNPADVSLRKGRSRLIYFALTAIVPISYFVFQSIFTRMEVNWPAPIFFGGLFLFAALLRTDHKKRSRLLPAQCIWSLVLILIISVQTYVPLLPLKGKSDPTHRYFLYQCFNNDLKDFLNEQTPGSPLRIVSNNYQIPSMINLYASQPVKATCLSIGYHETLYAFLYPDEDLIEDDFLFLWKGTEFPEKLRPYFSNIEFIKSFTSMRGDNPIRSYGFWLVKNYTGKSITTDG
jgi:4-amino-4-deoxy-L-arabinose transferase-like glycosyltransferase